MNDKTLELKKKAENLSRKAIKYSNKIQKTISNKELEKLEEMEAEADKLFEEYLTEYYRSIGSTKPEFNEPDFPIQYEPDDEIGHTERVVTDY
jgi:uncharacterized coiled-coil DUF342 family protein